MTVGGLTWAGWRPTYPDPAGYTVSRPDISAVLRSAPLTPTVKARRFVAVPLPGLENERGLESPSLTPDLLQFVVVRNRGRNRGVFLARRPTSEAPFSDLKRLQCCPPDSTFPALSPDGKELIFTVRGSSSQLRCASSDDAFTDSQAVMLQGARSERMHLNNAQWLDQNHLRIAVTDPEYRRRRDLLAVRSANEPHVLEVERSLTLPNPWPRYTASADLKRYFYRTASGPRLTSPFVGNHYISLDAASAASVFQPGDRVTESTVWVAPAEDMLCLTVDGVLCFWRFR